MPMFVVLLRRSGPEWDPSRPLEEQSGWPEHAAFMDGLVEAGFVVLGGPLSDEERVVHAVEAGSEDEIRSTLAQDPWSGSHLVLETIDPWTIRLDGRLRAQPATPASVSEARFAATDEGLVPQDEGWFVLNARDARWLHAEGRSAWCDFEGEQDFAQLGINVQILEPGVPMSMYHWESDQEDFVVLSGEALLIVEGEERRLARWDLVHCPPGTRHTIVGAGDGPCVVLAVGAREHQDGEGWGGYSVAEVARRHQAGVERETTEPREAYAHVARRAYTRYRDGWLP